MKPKRVELLPIRELLPHEETMDSRLATLLEDIALRGIVEKPIIVDEKTYTIIDGHHRFNALRKLKAKMVPVILADYSKDIYRIESFMKSIVVEAVDKYRALEIVESILRSYSSRYYEPTIITIDNTSIKLYINPVDLSLALKEYCRNFKPRGKKQYIVKINPPPLKPQQIVSSASEEILLPPRTTRHITSLKRYHYPVKITRLY